MGAGSSLAQPRGVVPSSKASDVPRSTGTSATTANRHDGGDASKAAASSGGTAATNTNQGTALLSKRDELHVIVRLLEPGEALSQEVGRVIEGAPITGSSIPPPPPETIQGGTQFGWFVEDLERPGTWEPYAKESADRLEDAFLNMRSTCTVVMKKRSYTVNLQTMQQLPAASAGAASTYPAQQQQQRTREVKRVPVVTYTDPDTGELKVRETSLEMVDPFADDEEESANGQLQKIAEGAGDVIGAVDDAAAASATDGSYLPHLIRTVVPHTSPIYTMECTPEVQQLCPEARAIVEPAGGALVLSSGGDLQLLEWSVQRSNVVTRYALPGTTPRNAVLTANYSSTAKWVVAGLDDCTARLYAVGNPTEVYRLRGHTHKVYGAGILAGDTQAVTASMDCRVKLWDIETGICVQTVVPHKSHIFTLRPHPTDTNFALTAGEDRVVCMHDLRLERSVAAVFTGHERTIWDVDWNPADTTFAACGMDCTARIFDPRVSTAAVETLRSHSRALHSIKYTPRGRGLLSCSKDTFVSMFDSTNWRVQWQAKAHAASVFRVRYHVGKSVMLTASSDSSVNVWSWGALAQL